ncbi:MAG: glycosyltransferase 87 family protein [Anaerolineae bacterium]
MKGLRPILLLFLAFRLSLLAFWPADQLARWSDYDYYYEIAGWVEQGRLPYLHYWVEYPPLFPYLSVLLYLLAPHYAAYVTGLALVQLGFEAGSLVLLYRLARRVVGEERAGRVAWTYALLFAPLATWWLSFDAISIFFLLLAVERWLAGRRVQSALAVGAGGLVKWLPLLFLPVVTRFRRSWREAAGYAAVALTVVGLVLGLLALLSPTYTLASLRSLGSRASWQTVWALLDGNLGTGAYQASRLDPAAATLSQGNPARVPTWLTLLLFGALYLWLWWRTPGRKEPRCVLRFTALTVLVFFLWSRGWSPQWLGTLVPLVLLSLPLERATLYLVVLTFVNIAEWPVLLGRGMNGWLWVTIPLRTGLFLLLAVELWQKLRE